MKNVQNQENEKDSITPFSPPPSLPLSSYPSKKPNKIKGLKQLKFHGVTFV